MTESPLILSQLGRVDPQKLLDLLVGDGWTPVGGRTGAYTRVSPPANWGQDVLRDSWSLLVPLDRSAPDYPMLMQAAISELAGGSLESAKSSSLIPRIQMGQTDSFYFRKESAAPPGLISWRVGEDLIHSARQTLVAGAKAHMSQLRRFSNRFGQFAGRYLDTIFMGQTAVGSYVVTAYAPADVSIAMTSSKAGPESIPGLGVVPGREVTLAVGRALEATQEAVSHFRDSGSLSGFDAAVSRGVSYDLLTALERVVKDADNGDITLEWESGGAASTSSVKFEFIGGDAAVLQRASSRITVPRESDPEISVDGRVHLLTKKQVGGPGVFGIETVGPGAKKYRVRLSDSEEYHIAVKAHDEDLVIRVHGRPETDGTLTWLYDASVYGLVGPIEQSSRRPAGQDPNQLTLEE